MNINEKQDRYIIQIAFSDRTDDIFHYHHADLKSMISDVKHIIDCIRDGVNFYQPDGEDHFEIEFDSPIWIGLFDTNEQEPNGEPRLIAGGMSPNGFFGFGIASDDIGNTSMRDDKCLRHYLKSFNDDGTQIIPGTTRGMAAINRAMHKADSAIRSALGLDR